MSLVGSSKNLEGVVFDDSLACNIVASRSSGAAESEESRRRIELYDGCSGSDGGEIDSSRPTGFLTRPYWLLIARACPMLYHDKKGDSTTKIALSTRHSGTPCLFFMRPWIAGNSWKSEVR